MMNCLTVSAVNVNGLRGSQSRLKAATICHLFTDAPQDIVCLLDTRLDSTTEPHLTQHWQKKSLFVHNTLAHTNGIALLFNTDKAKINQTIADPQGRYVLVVAEVNAQPLLIVPVYAPASSPVERRLFFEHLHRQIDLVKTERHNVILLGDFNVTENDVMDRLAATGSKDPSLPALQKILSTHSLEDFWRKSHPHDVSYTFRGVRGSSSRIDRVYTSRQFRNLLIKSDILPFVHSDHDMVEVTLRISATLRGNGIWSLDPELLAEEAYRVTIIPLIERWSAKRDHFPSLLEWWDAFKLRIKNVSRQYSRQRGATQRRHHQSVVKRLRQLSRRPDPSPPILAFTATLRQQLKELEEAKAKRAILHAKAQWVEEGEKCSSYFLRLQTKRKQDTTMHAIKVSATETATTSASILAATESYYKKLYTQTPTSDNLQNIFLSKMSTTLSPVSALSCEGDITAAELKNAVYNSNRHKSPGSDGLPLEFYLTFFPQLKDDFLLLANDIPALDSLSATQRNAVITCIPKDGDLTLLANWRPISVLNADYKIISKVIADRVAKVLPDIVHQDQTCNIQDRKIQYNLSLIRDVIDYGNSTTKRFCVLTIDQMKAFDKVSWSFLRRVLGRFKFGPRLTQWVDILYRNITSQVKVNGYVSTPFPLQQGVRQGCPLSPLLYVLYAEVLAESIRQSPDIIGIPIGDTVCKVSQYADDTTLFLHEDGSLYALAELLTAYQAATGAVVNPSKCIGLWLGGNRFRPDTPLGYTWSSTHIKILGLYFGPAGAGDRNFDIAANKYYKTLHLWSSRDLSMKGKRIVINQLAHSKLVYPSHVFPCPRRITTALQAATMRFFHSGKRIVVAPDFLTLPVPLGGMGLIDINRRLRATRLTWVSRLFDTKCKGKWRETMTYFLDTYRQLGLGRLVFKTFLSCHRQTLLPLPSFYRALLQDWDQVTQDRRTPPSTLPLIYQEPIFYNPFVTSPTRTDAIPTPLKPPYWYQRANISDFRTIGDICYQYQAGFHRLPELVDLAGHPGVRAFLPRLLQGLPRAWHDAIFRPPTSLRRPDDISLTLKDVYSRAVQRDVSTLKSLDFYLLAPHKTFLHIQTDCDLDDRMIYTRWDRLLGPTNWKKTFLHMYNNHIDKHVTDVQYKHIHGKIAPRLTLFRSRLQDSALCTRCRQTPEELRHIFLDCPHSRRIWEIVMYHLSLLTARPAATFDTIKFIVVGFADSPFPPPLIQAAEDLRLAFFFATWTSRNRSLWDQVEVPSAPLYVQHISRTLSHRYRASLLSHQLPMMLHLYGHTKLFTLDDGKITVHLPGPV